VYDFDIQGFRIWFGGVRMEAGAVRANEPLQS